MRARIIKLLIIIALLAIFILAGVFLLLRNKKGNFLSPVTKTDEYKMELVSGKDVFASGESLVFQYKVSQNGGFGVFFKNIFKDEFRNAKIEAEPIEASDQSDARPELKYAGNGQFSVAMNSSLKLKPGKHTFKIAISDPEIKGGEKIEFLQDFFWGVLAVNSDKSVYTVGDSAFLQMAVLGDDGHTICDANLEMEITKPDGEKIILATSKIPPTPLNKGGEGGIIRNPQCGPDNVIKNPDYYAYYSVAEKGIYKISLTAHTENGDRTVIDKFEASDAAAFDIRRTGPTRIYPKADYEMRIRVRSKENFSGNIVESVPESFKLVSRIAYRVSQHGKEEMRDVRYEMRDNNGEQWLIFKNIEMKTGEELELAYTFDAPDISPEFYLLGPLTIKGSKSPIGLLEPSSQFQEIRKWQIASDAVGTRANTVKFLGGTYSGNGTSGQLSDTDYSFSPFQFKLGEDGVIIKNAFVIFETQFEAYANNSGSYTGYSLAFDSCSGSCTPDAFNGSGNVVKTDSSILAYDSNSSNMARLIFDVTGEAQLASYIGEGSVLSGQIGYRINRGAATASIASAKAALVITYIYSEDSANVTKTVSYPLESKRSGDSGTRGAAQANNCTSNCASFDYNMQIPEFSSGNKLSQWFEVQNQNYNNGANDVTTALAIQGVDVASSPFVLEAANSGQGNFPSAIYPAVSGFNENTSQVLRYQASSSGSAMYYLLGGEISETYIASSSAATSTRTVSYPIGVISNGLSTATSSASINVYFPENGSSGGKVAIKKAWLRIISSNSNTAASKVDVSTRVGNNNQSSNYSYYYRASTPLAKPSFNIIHVIPQADYSELATANASSSKSITVYATSNSANQGGISVELMITYAYSGETEGHAASISIFAGQSEADGNSRLATSSLRTVFPESGGTKTIYSAGLLSSYLLSDGEGSVQSVQTKFDANLSSSSPSCANSFNSQPGANNAFTEIYKNIMPLFASDGEQEYYSCFSTDGGGVSSEGAKMNGILTYAYGWQDSPPLGSINSVGEMNDGSGKVVISATVNDQDKDNLKAKIEYEPGSSCSFISPGKATIEESGITASHGSPSVDNGASYQIGSSSSWIITSMGQNIISFSWLSKTDVPAASGTYCLRLTVNDGRKDQPVSSVALVNLDNVSPAITNVTLPSSNYKIGDMITATITTNSDNDTYGLASSTINNIGLTNIRKINNSTYQADYFISNGDSDRAAGSIPVSISLADSFGNVSNIFTAVQSNTASIDANAPMITYLSVVPSSGLLKIGDHATATFALDAGGYAFGDIKINNIDASGTLTSLGGNIYEISYTVNEGDNDSPTSVGLPIDITLSDAAGNSTVYSIPDPLNRPGVDAHRPVINSVSFSPESGTIKSNDEVYIFIQADNGGYLPQSILINGKDVSTTFVERYANRYQMAYFVKPGDSYVEDSADLPVYIVLKDGAGNTSAPYIIIDPDHKPGIDARIPSQPPSLLRPRDILSDYNPGSLSNHSIVFIANAGIPPLGQIIVDAKDFIFPNSLDYKDIDLAVSSSWDANYAERRLGDSVSADIDKVEFADSKIFITLNSSAGIEASQYVRMKIGKNAVYEEAGANQLRNPDLTGSRKIFVETLDQAAGSRLAANDFFVNIGDTIFNLTSISDTIKTSWPSGELGEIGNNHAIKFKNTRAIPPSGKIIITPAPTFFTIPAEFDYTDVDFSVSPEYNGLFIERPLFSIPDAVNDGVEAISGASGNISITLNSTEGVPENSTILLKLGTNANYGGSGSREIINPYSPGSYRINIKTYDEAGRGLDKADSMIAILSPVSMHAKSPVRKMNGRPIGVVLAGTAQVYMTLETNFQTTCRFSKMQGLAFEEMSSSTTYYHIASSTEGQFNTGTSTGGVFHQVTLAGLEDGKYYHFYVRCFEDDGQDYEITFSVERAGGGNESGEEGETGGGGEGTGGSGGGGTGNAGPGGGGGGTGGGTGAGSGSGGSAGGGGGSGGGSGGGTGNQSGSGSGSGNMLPYPPEADKPQVELSGWAYPLSPVSVLKDGNTVIDIKADGNAAFRILIPDLSQGVYTFGVRAKDDLGLSSPVKNTTFWIKKGTKTTVTDIFIPPTIDIKKSQINKGDLIELYGQTAPKGKVEVWVSPVKDNLQDSEIVKKESKTAENGKWSMSLDPKELKLSKGEYRVKARSNLTSIGYSDFSSIVSCGIESPYGDSSCERADLNKDGKKNLTDFSIMMFHWNTNHQAADINLDGLVNLVDFSMLMFCWTG